MEKLKVRFEMPFVNAVRMRPKQCDCLKHYISHARLCEHLKFVGYGVINYEDKAHWSAEVDVEETYSRGQVNCLVYDMLPTKYMRGLLNEDPVYNKLIIFQQGKRKDLMLWSFVMFNTETGKFIQCHTISQEYEMDFDDLAHNIWYIISHHAPNQRQYFIDKYGIDGFPTVRSCKEYDKALYNWKSKKLFE